jgi:D-sedoheptulose 7-phosphate isomerase
MAVLEALEAVDEVLVFDEDTPQRLIEAIKPAVLVKGGDWDLDRIVGKAFVESYGGIVTSLPLLGEYSTTAVITKASNTSKDAASMLEGGDLIHKALIEHSEVVSELTSKHAKHIHELAVLLVETLRSGNKILLCGNGGSAADAQHLAAEIVGRFEVNRGPLPAIALTTDTSALTAIGNDFGFQEIYSRQVSALGRAGDVLVCISTSGNSPNIVQAAKVAESIGVAVAGLTGRAESELSNLADVCIRVPSDKVARIQECHITVGHIVCSFIDEAFK